MITTLATSQNPEEKLCPEVGGNQIWLILSTFDLSCWAAPKSTWSQDCFPRCHVSLPYQGFVLVCKCCLLSYFAKLPVYLFSTLPHCFSFSGEILLFFNKEIGNISEFFSSSEIQLILIFFFTLNFTKFSTWKQ